MQIAIDDLTHPAVLDLLVFHRSESLRYSPPCSVHALDADALRGPGVTFWTMWDGDALAGMGALKAIDARHGEVKSMRTVNGYQRRGVGAVMLDHLIAQARARGWMRLSLETGSMAAFAPARAMYERAGFVPCAPFTGYAEDPLSCWYTLALE